MLFLAFEDSIPNGQRTPPGPVHMVEDSVDSADRAAATSAAWEEDIVFVLSFSPFIVNYKSSQLIQLAHNILEVPIGVCVCVREHGANCSNRMDASIHMSRQTWSRRVITILGMSSKDGRRDGWVSKTPKPY